MTEQEKYMKAALKLAHRAAEEGEVPVGAVVVCDGKTLVIDGGTAENGAKMVEYLQKTRP